jgi:hypothetical protein
MDERIISQPKEFEGSVIKEIKFQKDTTDFEGPSNRNGGVCPEKRAILAKAKATNAETKRLIEESIK